MDSRKNKKKSKNQNDKKDSNNITSDKEQIGPSGLQQQKVLTEQQVNTPKGNQINKTTPKQGETVKYLEKVDEIETPNLDCPEEFALTTLRISEIAWPENESHPIEYVSAPTEPEELISFSSESEMKEKAEMTQCSLLQLSPSQTDKIKKLNNQYGSISGMQTSEEIEEVVDRTPGNEINNELVQECLEMTKLQPGRELYVSMKHILDSASKIIAKLQIPTQKPPENSHEKYIKELERLLTSAQKPQENSNEKYMKELEQLLTSAPEPQENSHEKYFKELEQLLTSTQRPQENSHEIRELYSQYCHLQKLEKILGTPTQKPQESPHEKYIKELENMLGTPVQLEQSTQGQQELPTQKPLELQTQQPLQQLSQQHLQPPSPQPQQPPNQQPLEPPTKQPNPLIALQSTQLLTQQPLQLLIQQPIVLLQPLQLLQQQPVQLLQQLPVQLLTRQPDTRLDKQSNIQGKKKNYKIY